MSLNMQNTLSTFNFKGNKNKNFLKLPNTPANKSWQYA